MSRPIGPALWIVGHGHPVAAVTRALRSAVHQSVPFAEIVCLVGQEALDEVTVSASSSPVPTRVIASRDTDDSSLLNALLAESTTGWFAWLDAASALEAGASAIVASALERFDVDLFDVDLFYGDSALPSGEVVRRPAFSPIRLRSQDYLGGFRGFRVDRVREAGGFRAGLRGAHAHDLALRLGADDARVLSIPEVLSVSPEVVGATTDARRSAVEDHLSALGMASRVRAEGVTSFRVRYPLAATPLVSIVIPTRGGKAVIRGEESILVVDAVRGIIERSTYPSMEFVIVADDETPQGVVDRLGEVAGERLRLVRWSGPFNFSGKMNRGAVHARGDYLVLLNDDVELITPDWIEVMLGLAQQATVGMVGTLLFFEDGTVQHGGHLYRDSWAGHIAFGWEAGRDDALGSLGVEREVSGVTAACAMISADTFWEIGGFSTLYAGNYNDVDLSLKVRSTGRSIVWTPHARLFHFESKSRVATVVPAELETIRRHWGMRLLADPYWR